MNWERNWPEVFHEKMRHPSHEMSSFPVWQMGSFSGTSMEESMKQGQTGYGFYGWETATITDSHGLTPCDYYDLLRTIWSADTCAPRMRSDWTPENRTLGQCSITAFLMQELFGGKVYGVALKDGNFHCFNVVGDCVFDLTKEQFEDAVPDYHKCTEQSREIHFLKEEKRQRYELLKSRLFQVLEKDQMQGRL